MNKVCTKCGVEKSVEEFNKRPERKNGNAFSSHCKSCISQTHKVWRGKNRERLIKKLKQYHITHQEEARKYRRTNRKRDSAYTKEYYLQHKEERLRKQNERRAKNRLIPSAQTVARYALITGKIKRKLICEICNINPVQASHHPDYTKPLEIMQVCDECHMRLHADLKRKELNV